MSSSHVEICPKRIAEYYGEDITPAAIEKRLHDTRKDSYRLQKSHDTTLAGDTASKPSNYKTCKRSPSTVLLQECSSASSQSVTNESKRLVDRDRHIRKDLITPQQNLKRSKVGESSVPRKRHRKRESSETCSDTDAQFTTPKRYVRTSPKTCPSKGSVKIAVVVPETKIDKSLYSPYLPSSPRQEVVVDSDSNASRNSPAEEKQNQQRAPDGVERPNAVVRAESNTLFSLLNESNRQAAETSSMQLQDHLQTSSTLFHPSVDDNCTPPSAQPPRTHQVAKISTSWKTAVQRQGSLQASPSPDVLLRLSCSPALTSSQQLENSVKDREESPSSQIPTSSFISHSRGAATPGSSGTNYSPSTLRILRKTCSRRESHAARPLSKPERILNISGRDKITRLINTRRVQVSNHGDQEAVQRSRNTTSTHNSQDLIHKKLPSSEARRIGAAGADDRVPCQPSESDDLLPEQLSDGFQTALSSVSAEWNVRKPASMADLDAIKSETAGPDSIDEEEADKEVDNGEGRQNHSAGSSERNDEDENNENCGPGDCDWRANGEQSKINWTPGDAEERRTLDDIDGSLATAADRLPTGKLDGDVASEHGDRSDWAQEYMIIDDSDFCQNSEQERQAVEHQLRLSQRSSEHDNHHNQANVDDAWEHSRAKGKQRATSSEVRDIYNPRPAKPRQPKKVRHATAGPSNTSRKATTRPPHTQNNLASIPSSPFPHPGSPGLGFTPHPPTTSSQRSRGHYTTRQRDRDRERKAAEERKKARRAQQKEAERARNREMVRLSEAWERQHARAGNEEGNKHEDDDSESDEGGGLGTSYQVRKGQGRGKGNVFTIKIETESESDDLRVTVARRIRRAESEGESESSTTTSSSSESEKGVKGRRLTF